MLGSTLSNAAYCNILHASGNDECSSGDIAIAQLQASSRVLAGTATSGSVMFALTTGIPQMRERRAALVVHNQKFHGVIPEDSGTENAALRLITFNATTPNIPRHAGTMITLPGWPTSIITVILSGTGTTRAAPLGRGREQWCVILRPDGNGNYFVRPRKSGVVSAIPLLAGTVKVFRPGFLGRPACTIPLGAGAINSRLTFAITLLCKDIPRYPGTVGATPRSCGPANRHHPAHLRERSERDQFG